ncbi:DUF6438 domain-containing protein [Sphingomonas canadensis]|uniref:DUF6438 domain-containing protein n=1 Tax=Sphingomonas canadensis TaxID=1219257 RepID=A0ABW3H7R5_9SPHN|nr:DUF6438 domain-containing protein [Sphingomonas canadensis]MCW3836499.1 DUF6438 domain-containing protein [Sphingomonas canadensis]
MRWMAGLGALALAGCTQPGAGPNPGMPVPIEGDSIRYETGPCFGACPVYSVTVRPDGSGVFNGIRFTAVTGERAFKLTPEQYRAFEAKLAPYRPESGERRYTHGEPGCEMAATDMPSASVTWTRMIGDSQQLYYYFGCDVARNSAIAQAVGEAPELLPIESLIGKRP